MCPVHWFQSFIDVLWEDFRYTAKVWLKKTIVGTLFILMGVVLCFIVVALHFICRALLGR